MNSPQKTSFLPWVIVVILGLSLLNSMAGPAAAPAPAEQPTIASRARWIVRWLAWFELMPTNRQSCPPEEATIQEHSEHFVDNQPPDRAEGPQGHPQIDHGHGW